LLELETIQGWRKDPDTYTSGVTNGIFLLMKRNFAPPEERLRSVIARERQFPKAFAAARQNLQNPPPIYTEIALEQLPDDIIPQRCSKAVKVKDAKPLARNQSPNLAVIAEFQSYQKFPRYGAAAFARRLRRERKLSQETAARRNGGYPARLAAGNRHGQPHANQRAEGNRGAD
jgi:hypothetical protein